jgi:serine/threonine-protein kinase
MVDWYGASAFAAWRAARTGRPWRLPAELEWEKAARGVDGRLFPWGDQADATWMCIRTSHAERAMPAPVTDYALDESPYGVRGMAGGVRDWCLDRGDELGPPIDGDRARIEPDLDPDPEAARVYRGGDWYGLAVHARAAYRAWNKPRTRNYSLGFRCARPLA